MRQVAWIAAVTMLAGCSTGGLHDLAKKESASGTPVTVAEIQRAIGCEFQYALSDSQGSGRDVIRKWSAVIELSLSARDTYTVVPGLGQVSAKVGNATLSTTSPSPSMTLDGYTEDRNTMTYVTTIADQADKSTCPEQGSLNASDGLGLSDLLVGTSQVLNSGGRIAASSSVITSAGVGPVNGAVVSAGTVFPVATVKEAIPTVKYDRSFTVSRKAGGGLSFKVGDISLSLTASSTGRERKDNKITVTMGPATGKLTSRDQADIDGTLTVGDTISLEDSIFLQRQAQIDALKGITPDQVVVVNQAAP